MAYLEYRGPEVQIDEGRCRGEYAKFIDAKESI